MPRYTQLGSIGITEKEWLDVEQDEYGAVVISHWRHVGDRPRDRGSMRFADWEVEELPEALEELAAMLRGE